jgi:hypothetical protein
MGALTQRSTGHVLRRPGSDCEPPAAYAVRVNTHPPASGKASLYALMMSLWAAIIFGAMMTVSIV